MRVAVLTVVLLGCYLGVQADMSQQYIDYILQMHNQYSSMQGNNNNMYNMMWNEDLAQQAYDYVSQCRFDYGNYGNGFFGNNYYGSGSYGNGNYGNGNFGNGNFGNGFSGNGNYGNGYYGNGYFGNGYYGNNYNGNNYYGNNYGSSNFGSSNYGNNYYWQNLAYYYGDNDMDNMEQAFNDWYQYYNYANTNGGVSRFYNNMDWYNAKEVGCAYYRCPNMYYYGRYMQNTWYFACRYNPMNMNNNNMMGNMNFMNNMEMNNMDMNSMEMMNNMDMNSMNYMGNMNYMNNMEMNNMDMNNMDMNMMNNFGYNQEFMEGQQFDNNFSGDCMDKYPNCPRFSYKCQNNQMWMRQYCPMTCGYCSK